MVPRPGTNYVRAVEGPSDSVQVVQAVAELSEGEAWCYPKNVEMVVAKRMQNLLEKSAPAEVY
jgi:hypothetical protein